jgi:RNA polymerase primary sigma factor
MTTGAAADDHRLVRAVLAGEPAATERFFKRIADVVWSACGRLTNDETAARAAFADVLAGLQAEDFRRLRPYDGRSRLDTFIALLARDLLAQRLLHLLREDAQRGWRAFEGFFQADIHRLILRRLPGPAHDETRRDAYQDICVALITENYRRLKAYQGAGSYNGFVLHMVDRLLVDFIRKFSMRRRMPAAIARLPALGQEIFRLIHWQGVAPDAAVLTTILAQRMRPPLAAPDVVAGLRRVQSALPAGYSAASSPAARLVALDDAPELSEGGTENVPSAASPEDIAIERESENLLSVATAVLRDVAATLPEAERLYLQIALGGAEPLPAREMARLMQRPVEEIYKLKQRALKHLKDALEDHEAVKKWQASV